MKNCDYEITYYQDGSPKTFRVPALEVDDELSPEELTANLKKQLEGVLTSAYYNKDHILYDTVQMISKNAVVPRQVLIDQVPTELINTSVGVTLESEKKEYDGNVKLSDLKAHLDTAKHPYKELMLNVLKGEDLRQPTIHFIAEKYTSFQENSGETEVIDGPYGVYTMGNDDAVDTIKIYTGGKELDLDSLNKDKELAKIFAHQLVLHKVNRGIDEWIDYDVDDFSNTFKDIYQPLLDKWQTSKSVNFNRVMQGLHKGTKDKRLGIKRLFAYALTDKTLAKALNDIEIKGKPLANEMLNRITTIAGIEPTQNRALQEILAMYDNLKLIVPAKKAKKEIVDPPIIREQPKEDVTKFEAKFKKTNEEEDIQLIEFYNSNSEELETNYLEQLEFNKLQATNSEITKELTNFLKKPKQSLLTKESNLIDLAVYKPTNIKYDIEIFGKDDSMDYKEQQLKLLGRGGVVFLGKGYKSGIVLSYNKKNNTYLIGSVIKGEEKVTELNNGIVDVSQTDEGYHALEVTPDMVKGIAFNLITSKELDIKANTYAVNKIEKIVSDYKTRIAPLIFNTREEAVNHQNKFKLDNYDLLMINGNYIFKSKTSDTVYNGSKVHTYISKTAIETNKTSDLWNDLQIGDMIAKSFKIRGTEIVSGGIITKKTANTITYVTSHFDPSNETIKNVTSVINVSDIELQNGKGLKDVVAVGFNNKTTKNIETLINKYNKVALSKDFSTDDKKEFKKSSKTNTKVLQTLASNLQDMYGVNTILLTSEEIADRFDLNPNAKMLYSKQRAFVFGGEIFINTDKASLAEPIHEFGHIILQGLKASNNETYRLLMAKIASHPQHNLIAEYYPELNEDELNEEVFVTTLGEMFNGRVANKLTANWENNNKPFLSKIFDSIKKFLAELFGIDSRSFFDLTPYEIMNMSFDELHSNFGNSILNGTFISVAEISELRGKAINADNFLKEPNGEPSRLFNKFIELGMDYEEASNLWLNTQTSAFKEWIGDEDAFDSLYKFTKEHNVYEKPETISDTTKLTYLRGSLISEGDKIRITSNDQAKSIYNARYAKNTNNIIYDPVESYITANDLTDVIDKDVHGSKQYLEAQFPMFQFEILTGFGTNYLTWYSKPTLEVEAFKKELMNNNYIKQNC